MKKKKINRLRHKERIYHKHQKVTVNSLATLSEETIVATGQIFGKRDNKIVRGDISLPFTVAVKNDST